MSALEAVGISKAFGATQALADVSLALRKGEIHALVGENGSGKSTLMNVIAGVHRPDAGTLTLRGVPFAPRNPLHARDAGVGMIHQELALCPDLSVAENIVLGLEPTRLGWVRRTSARGIAREALASLGHVDLDPDARLRSLPIALRQVVEIARATASGCDVLLFDEPTSSLGEADAERLFEVLARLRSEGKAILYVSHFLEEVQRVADHITVLRDGAVVGEFSSGNPSHLRGRGAGVRGVPPSVEQGGGPPEAGSDALETDAGGEQPLTPAPLPRRGEGFLGTSELVSLMAGRAVSEQFPHTPRTPGETLLAIEEVAGVRLPKSASLELRRGEVVGIAGLNGSGRTELLRAVFGLDPVRRGVVRVGLRAGRGSPARRWAQGVGLLSEDRKEEGLAIGMTLAENLALSNLPLVVSPGRLERDAEPWLSEAGVKYRHAGQAVRELSGGNQQKIALARLLRHGVDVLLLDEPTRGIDVASKHRLYELIDRAACEGKAVLVVSSYLPELFGICDRIAVMHRGELGGARPTSTWTPDSVLREATGS